jgi:NDP-sugar pyrophosphorylase family protein
MLVHRNQNQWDQSNVVLENGYVKIYDKKNTLPEMEYIDAGLSILKKEVIREIPPNQFYDLADFYQALARRKLLKAYEIQQRFYEVGSPAGLKEFASLVEQGGLP